MNLRVSWEQREGAGGAGAVMEGHRSSGVVLFGAQPQDVDGSLWVGGTPVGVYCVASEAVYLLLSPRTSPPHLGHALFNAPCEERKCSVPPLKNMFVSFY